MKTQVEKAYDYAMREVEKLREFGIKVQITIPKRVKKGNYRDTVEKYHPPERLSVDKWRHVTLFPTKEQVDLVHDAVCKLFKKKITFDTGGGCDGGRDWEMDWSFKYTKEKDVASLKSLQENEELIRESF